MTAGSKNKENYENKNILSVIQPYSSIFFGEFIGTIILLFVGCASTIDFDGDPLIPHHVKGLGFGFSVLLAIQVCGHITACHINPAVSLVSLLLGAIDFMQFCFYLLAQFLGALCGFILLKILFPSNYIQEGFCMTKISNNITTVQGFFIELVITCILCLVLCSVWDKRNASNSDSTPIRFAFIVTILSIIAGPLTGASMNTARSFGPAIFGSASDWNDQWIFWIAPNISPFISVGIYKLFFTEPKLKNRCGSENELTIVG